VRRLLPVWLFALLISCGGGHTVPATAPTARPASSGDSALWVADVRSANVVHVDSSGAPQLTLQGGIAPAGIGVTSTGDVVVAGDQQSVLYFHPQSPTPFNSFTSLSICGAKGVALDFSDNIYVGDVLCPEVWLFNAGTTGTNAMPTASLSWDKKTYGGLLAFDVDPAGNVYILTGDANAQWILVYQLLVNSSGGKAFNALTKIPAGSDFPNAEGLTVDANHDIYVVNDNKTLLEYTPTTDPSTPYTLTSKTGLDGLCNTHAIRHAAIPDTTGTRNLLYAADAGCFGSGSQIVAYTLDTPKPAASPSPSPTPFTIAVANGPAGSPGVSEKTALAIDQSAGASGGSVYVTTALADIVSGWCAGCIDKAPPSVQFSLGYPGMDGIQMLLFANGLLYTMDSAAPAVTIYTAPSKFATGVQSPAPVARLLGKTPEDMCGLSGIVSDAQQNLLVTLACPNENYVAKYVVPSPLSGTIAVQATPFAGMKAACGATNPLCNPQQLAFDKSGNLYVTSYGKNPVVDLGNGSVVKYSPTGAVQAIMVSPDIHNPSGVAIDPQGNIAVLSNLGTIGGNPEPEIAFFAQPANQASPTAPVNVTPIRTLKGDKTQIGAGTQTPFPQLQIGSDGTIYVNEYNYVLVFAPGASGNVAPAETYNDNNKMTGGTGIAIQP
jgi:hypothetical protein